MQTLNSWNIGTEYFVIGMTYNVEVTEDVFIYIYQVNNQAEIDSGNYNKTGKLLGANIFRATVDKDKTIEQLITECLSTLNPLIAKNYAGGVSIMKTLVQKIEYIFRDILELTKDGSTLKLIHK